MNRNAHGEWLEGRLESRRPETPAKPDGADEANTANAATIRLPEGTPNWNDSTIFLQRIHQALITKGWGTGPI